MKLDNKKVLKIIIGIIIFVCILFGVFKLYQYYRIKTAKVEVVLTDDLNIEIGIKEKVSKYIDSINGKIVDDYLINPRKLGKLEVPFEFVNNDGIKVKYSYTVNVVDTTEPLIWLGNSYSVPVGSDIDLTKKIMCADNYDDRPSCIIEGDYDLNTEGVYNLVFSAEDKSGNKESQNFSLNVYTPTPNTGSNDNSTYEKVNTDFNEVVKNYKNDNTKIGLDISEFQYDVDFDVLKKSGVEFVILRVGGTRGTNGEYFLDKKFKQNIKNANRVGIDVGIYFYSYANSTKASIKDAKWVLKQIKDYDVNLPIAFDWEEWSSFNEYNLSFFKLTSIAEAFLNEVEKAGYEGMLYSSKTYLDYIWLPTKYDIWLAHYTSKTSYEGEYKFWQMCDNGKVNGINRDVDIDIMYIDKKNH